MIIFWPIQFDLKSGLAYVLMTDGFRLSQKLLLNPQKEFCYQLKPDAE